MEAVVSTSSWSCRAKVARGFLDRLIGLRRAGTDRSMLLPTWTVHGFGMRHAVLAIGIGRDHRIIGVRTLSPNRVVAFPGARYVLEMPIGSPIPTIGQAVRITDA